MAYNDVLVQTEAVVFTSTSLTLGYGAGQTVPPRYIICEPTANMTITLPLSTPSLPTSLTTPYIPGAGPGYPITIYNASSTPFSVTIAAATGDTLVNASVLTLQNTAQSFFSSPGENKWYGFGLTGSTGTISSFEVASDRIGAATTSFTMDVADVAYLVTAVKVVWGTASSAGGTLTVEKATGTQATGSGTALLTATIDTSATANTVVTGTLVATTATLTFAAGNRLNCVLGGTLTSLANCCVSVAMQKV